MQNEKKILLKIDSVLDELLSVAKQLEQISKTVISEEDILKLQNKQEELLSELKSWDEQLNGGANGTEIRKSPEWELLRKKLIRFQRSNEQYIRNLQEKRGLLKFDWPE